jgi:hypothetical protein
MMMAASAGLPSSPRSARLPPKQASPEALARQLSEEFGLLSPAAVTQCVADVTACVAHLGADATPALVERIARAHLIGRVKSQPPSGRPPP